MPTYLLETYMPGSHVHEAAAASDRARAAAEELARQGTAVRYVRSTFLPDDEMCFHIFEADVTATVDRVSLRAALGPGRIVPAVEVFFRV
jgi:hypothetical protein